MNATCRLGAAALLGVVAAFLVMAGTASADKLTATCTWGTQSQECDSSTWYPSAVSVAWRPDTPTSGPPVGCYFDVASTYNTDQVTTISCSASWNDGTALNKTYTLHIETSTPTISVAPSRPPDSGGWYNHGVSAAVVGASSFSHFAGCTPTTYAGPPSTAATVTATCTDYAGKTATATSSPFSYDASPPAIYAGADTGDGVVLLRWAASDIAPLSSVMIERAPGRHRKSRSLIYRSLGTSFADMGARNGVRYRYTLVVTDQAGNTATQVVFATPGPHLLAPGRGAVLSSPPALLWTAVRGASYYNVQVYRGSKKILSSWPTHPGLQLGPSWKFGRHHYRLRPGRYRWYVWPGFGKKTAARYGRAVGIATFVIS